MNRITVIGAGYVGLVTGTCFAELGNQVVCLDVDTTKIADLNRGVLPLYEPSLEELVRRNAGAGRLSFTTSYADALRDSEFIFIAVNTPAGPTGEADLRYVRQAAASIGKVLRHPATIITKSTVPIGTGDRVDHILARELADKVSFDVVANPEFLREGSAVADFLHPDRIVLGADRRAAAEHAAVLYRPLGCPILITDLRSAEMIKYASNAFLATKISFINEVALICERTGADVRVVADGMGLDQRIGRAFLDAGLGWGGSCFPKDVSALAHVAAVHGCHPQLLRTVIEINQDQRLRVIQKLIDLFGTLENRTLALLGLSFKPNTDDLRDAPAVSLAQLLEAEGAVVRAYDPVAMPSARRLLPHLDYQDDPYAAAATADATIVVTDWNEFKHLDLPRLHAAMKHPIIIDGRNIYDPDTMRALGFIYHGIGRGGTGEATPEARETTVPAASSNGEHRAAVLAATGQTTTAA